MEKLLFALLLGVWAALVIPSVIRSRRENAVAARPSTYRDEAPLGGHREQVLARRRIALIVLGVAVVGTLVAAIITGSWPVLAISLIVDVALAAYVAILLQIKQRKGMSYPPDDLGGYDDPGGRSRTYPG